MGKLIGKTIAITLASVIGALLIAFGAAALFAPRLVADMFDDMGAYSASIHFYERNFESTKTTDDLVLLIDKIDIKQSPEQAEKYLNKFISSPDFLSKCTALDREGHLIPMREYFLGLKAQALMLGDKGEKAIDFCKQTVAEIGYGEFNPFRAIVSSIGDELSSSQLQNIKEEILSVAANLTSEQLVFANADVQDINKLIQG